MRTPPRSELPEVLAFMQGLWAVVHRMERLSKQMGTRSGVTGPQRLVLRLVALFPGLSAGDLATMLHLHPSTLTGILRRLDDQGLISRTADPDDRRRTSMRLTSRGTRASTSTRATVEGAVAAALARTSDAHRDITRRFLEQLASCLDHEVDRFEK
ncbi:MAG: MarR family transcriptional regulator [Acidobacteria bacterium]|nr:MarR family transcriptional regulator [Acidobacteriota bacterium]